MPSKTKKIELDEAKRQKIREILSRTAPELLLESEIEEEEEIEESKAPVIPEPPPLPPAPVQRRPRTTHQIEALTRAQEKAAAARRKRDRERELKRIAETAQEVARLWREEESKRRVAEEEEVKAHLRARAPPQTKRAALLDDYVPRARFDSPFD